VRKLGNNTQKIAAANALEILLVLLVAFVVVFVGWQLVGADPFARQAVVWFANVSMLVTVGIGLRVRGQKWEHIGLTFRFGGRRALVRAVLQSIVVLIAALIAFVVGSVLIANIASAPESADMSGYEYLHGNLPMLLVALAAVYVVSSLGEEVLYRGFLMTRIAEMGKGSRAAWITALAVSAAVFGLAHFDWGLVGIVQTTFMGLALGASYLLVKRNLWVLILAHAYIDTLLLVQLYLGPIAASATNAQPGGQDILRWTVPGYDAVV
jgi:membrane protease YdiL (CAAX protease family)